MLAPASLCLFLTPAFTELNLEDTSEGSKDKILSRPSTSPTAPPDLASWL